MAEYLLEMRNIVKMFPSVRVLNQVNLMLKKGEVLALMGENGAGKSTLMKILMGIYTADEGEIFLEGKSVDFHTPREAMQAGIAMVYQELNPILDMSVYENIFAGRERKKYGFVDKKAMQQEATELLQRLEIPVSSTTLMRELSVAQMQLVEIAKALSMNSRIIVMDEPTSAITETEAELLFRQIQRLKQEGIGIIYISHRMDEIFRISDSIVVLRDGQASGYGSTAQMTEQQLIQWMVGREITEIFPKKEHPKGDCVLEVEHLVRGRQVQDISFAVHSGEVLGFAGLVGAGRSEVMETIFGITPAQQGVIKLHGKTVNIRNTRQAIVNKIAFVTEDRKQTGLNLIGTITENTTIVTIEKFARTGFLNKKREEEVTLNYMKSLRTKANGPKQLVQTLSGGNQQKVVLAKWLLAKADVIIMDEPTRGIDIGAKSDIYALIDELAEQGKAVIVISSEMTELMGVSDRIVVMCEGHLTGELLRNDFSQEKIMAYASAVGGRVYE